MSTDAPVHTSLIQILLSQLIGLQQHSFERMRSVFKESYLYMEYAQTLDFVVSISEQHF